MSTRLAKLYFSAVCSLKYKFEQLSGMVLDFDCTLSSINQTALTRRMMLSRRWPSSEERMRGLLPQESVRGPATRVKSSPGKLCSIPLYACSSLTNCWVSI